MNHLFRTFHYYYYYLSIIFILINLKLLILFVHNPNVLCYVILEYVSSSNFL
jgi:hypothetical protein